MTAYPTTDRKVFWTFDKDKSGCFFERCAVIVCCDKTDFDKYREIVMYCDEHGIMRGNRDEELSIYDRYDYIGKEGDTITPKCLHIPIRDVLPHNTYWGLSCVLMEAEEHFTIDKSKAEDTIKIRIQLGPRQECFRLAFHSDFYCFGDDISYNIKFNDYKDILRNLLIYPLATYCRYLDKPIGLDIDFAYTDEYSVLNPNFQNDDMVDEYRAKYLDKIRAYITEGVKELLKTETFEMEKTTSKETKPKRGKQDGVILPLNY